ncbi:MAG TPA: anthranilate synthase component I family protein [Planctomycetota bacterium]
MLKLSSPFPYVLWGDAAGADPFLFLTSKADRISLWREGRETTFRGNPFDVLSDLLRELAGRPGRAVGAFGYDLGQHLERLPRKAVDDLGFPDLVLGFYGERGGAIGVADYEDAFGGEEGPPAADTFTRDGYLDAVRRVKEYVVAGDVYQVNLSRRVHARIEADPLDVWEKLRARNPAPFAAFFRFGRRALLSVSPERFLELRDGRLLTRPIKGTRRRGPGAAEELLASPKDDAELAMIVDLERNDLGRVCETGTVRVTAPKTLETHPTVFHLSATVEGRCAKGPVDVLRATFPGGSITGAPKIRAMEIIDELEPARRGFYTGAIGAIGFDGTMDLSIAIRTVQADGATYYVQAGGGIVADSDPAAEYDETRAKAAAMADALGMRTA